MTKTTSLKTYILLAVIATVAIAAVTSQVFASVSSSGYLTTSACAVYAASVDTYSGSFASGPTALEAATGITDTVNASWQASSGSYTAVSWTLSQPVLISSNSDHIEFYGQDTEWVNVYAHDTSTGDWVLVNSGTQGTWGWHWQERAEAYALEGHYVDKVRITTNEFAMIYVDAIRVTGLCDDAPLPATPLPQAALPCITGTISISPTVRATMTPWVRTGTPVATRTPGGPTPTMPAPYTSTVQPVSSTVGYDSGVIKFDTDVSQLSALGNVNNGDGSNFLNWDAAIGPDGRPGVAMLHGFMGEVVTATHEAMSAVALFKASGYTSPVAVTWWARTAFTLTVDATHTMRVWYLDPEYGGVGNPAWVAVSPLPPDKFISNAWRKFGVVITPNGGSGKITGIAFTDSFLTTHFTTGRPCPSEYGCVYMDDLHVAYGDAAGLVLPYCEGTDPYGSNSGARLMKTCIINITTIDLSAACVAPTTIDFGAWLSYLWCRLWRFFGYFDENRAQWDAIIARQSVNEPFGSLIETGSIYDDLNTSIGQLRSSNKDQLQDPIDWVRMFMDGSALDTFPQFTVPDLLSVSIYMANCPSEAMFVSANIARGSCLALYLMRQTIIVSFLQWGINALFVIGVLMMMRGDLEKLAA
jgi:hypothetical protein